MYFFVYLPVGIYPWLYGPLCQKAEITTIQCCADSWKEAISILPWAESIFVHVTVQFSTDHQQKVKHTLWKKWKPTKIHLLSSLISGEYSANVIFAACSRLSRSVIQRTHCMSGAMTTSGRDNIIHLKVLLPKSISQVSNILIQNIKKRELAIQSMVLWVILIDNGNQIDFFLCHFCKKV